jgi:glycosyltransferase involved in cell wall biosynthesis
MSASSLLVDLRVAQSDRERGVPRYVQSLVLALGREYPDLDIACLVDRDRNPPLLLDQLGERCRIIGDTAAITTLRVTHFLQGGLFQSGETIPALFPVELAAHRPQLGAVVYDLIPWIFPDVYLADPGRARKYFRILPAVSHLDRLFTISNSVRHDVIAIANAAPQRVIAIHGGLDEGRWRTPREEGSPPLVDLIEPRGLFWLYVGGDDYRKNLPRLIEAVAILKGEGRLDAPLVIACQIERGRRDQLLGQAEAAGLRPGDDIILTGYVSDETLGQLFAGCMATIFPSLYEGLGLPVLESYAFGKPALASDTSSFVEIVPERCRFDPYSAASIADAMRRFHDDPRVARDSLAAAPGALALCQWPRAARKLGEWLYPPADRPSHVEAQAMWVVTSLPPEQTGVGIYTQLSLGAPTKPVVFFTAARDAMGMVAARQSLALARQSRPGECAQVEVLALGALDDARRSRPTQPVLFVLGNSEHHLRAVAHLAERGAGEHDAVHLHDVYIANLLRLYFGTAQRLRAGLLAAYPEARVDAWLQSARSSADSSTLLGPRWLVVAANVRHFVVNSEAAAERLRVDLGDLAAGVRIDVLFLPILPPGRHLAGARGRGPAGEFEPLRIGHFGILSAAKHPDRLAAACDAIARRRPIELVLAGFRVDEYVSRHDLRREYLRVVESPTDDELEKVMSTVDCAVQLRYPDNGESSGVVNQLIGLRRQVVCTRTGSYVDLDGVVRLVDPDVSPEDLATTIEQAAAAGWPDAADALVAARSPLAFEARLRRLLELDA